MHYPDTGTILAEWRGIYAEETVSDLFEPRDAAL